MRNAIMAMSGADRSKRFRIKHLASLRDKARDRMSAKRAADKAAKAAGKTAAKPLPKTPRDKASAIVAWAKKSLKVPPGHPKEGGPLVVPEYGVKFLRDALADDCHEAALVISRKNAKSAIVAVLILSYLVGPMRRAGWRCGVCSISREKAGELRSQCEAIAVASGLKKLRFWRARTSPAITSEAGASVDILSADKNSGAASSYDLAIIDEIGLLGERNRGLVNSMRSAVSAKAGKFLSLSVHGDGPFIPEILERKGAAGLKVHHYHAPEGCELADEAAHDAANPGLACGIKSRDYMRSEAARVAVTRSDEASFRALDLNQPATPGSEMIFSLAEWQACVVSALPPRSGSCCLGFDLGGSSSMTTLAAIWPDTGRLEAWGAFPGTPALKERARVDAAPYALMAERGELKFYAGRVTPVAEFLKDCAARLAGERVLAAGADRFRRAEAMQAIDGAELRWPMNWRGVGASAKADGSHDVRAFQRLVLSRKLRTVESLLLASAIKSSVIRRDASGNPALDKGSSLGRIDALSATVIAAGLAELEGMRPRRSWRPGGLV